LRKYLKEIFRDLQEDILRLVKRRSVGSEKHGLAASQIYPSGNQIPDSLVDYLVEYFSFISNLGRLDIASIGTCFAEEFARHLKSNNSVGNYLYEEPNIWNASANWGRVYTVRNLRQIIEYSFNSSFEIFIDKNKNGYFDPLRDYACGYKASKEKLTDDIIKHRFASKKIFKNSQLLVITLGQNEGWIDSRGFVWGSAPTVEARQRLDVNPIEFSYETNLSDLRWVIEKIREENANVKIMFTVSPVPAGATFIAKSVFVQSMAGKSVLRAVVHEVVKEYEGIMYFPSYELCLCDNKSTYKSDNRHVKFGKVREIFNLLDKTLFSESNKL
jgi:hypothetical protein